MQRLLVVVVFLVVLFFFCFLWVFWFLLVWSGFPVFAFASLHAFVPSLTGAQRTDSSPARKKTKYVPRIISMNLGPGQNRSFKESFRYLAGGPLSNTPVGKERFHAKCVALRSEEQGLNVGTPLFQQPSCTAIVLPAFELLELGMQSTGTASENLYYDPA